MWLHISPDHLLDQEAVPKAEIYSGKSQLERLPQPHLFPRLRRSGVLPHADPYPNPVASL
jgi:hypothetical protein